jgi:hypothetical protein
MKEIGVMEFRSTGAKALLQLAIGSRYFVSAALMSFTVTSKFKALPDKG